MMFSLRALSNTLKSARTALSGACQEALCVERGVGDAFGRCKFSGLHSLPQRQFSLATQPDNYGRKFLSRIRESYQTSRGLNLNSTKAIRDGGHARLSRHSTLAFENTSRAQQVVTTLKAQRAPDVSHGLSKGARKAMAWWMGGTAAWVFSMVVLGGLTRLTRSGLSMTDWKFTGERPPSNQEEWLAEFAKYQASPEYAKVNRSMTVEEFKFIYWMEYAHRMWGRLLGVFFVVPGSVFLAKGYVHGALARRLALLLVMGGTQGLVGWWMVRSGLQEPAEQFETPRVSPYRLAAHLGSAFTIYSILAWTTLSLCFPHPVSVDKIQANASKALKRWALPLSALIAFTGMSGAFVAGLDAGHAYNTFPLMAGRIIPEDYFQGGWRSMFEDTATVQFNHRLLATTTLVSVLSTWLVHRKAPLPGPSQALLTALMAVTITQVTLGVTTLLTYVPPSLGASHQATALTLFTVALALLHSLRPVISQSSLIARGAMPLTAVGVIAVGVAVTATQ